jgi:hypothetical protein
LKPNEYLEKVQRLQNMATRWNLLSNQIIQSVDLAKKFNFDLSPGVLGIIQSPLFELTSNQGRLGLINFVRNNENLGVHAYKWDSVINQLMDSNRLDDDVDLPDSILEPLTDLTPILEIALSESLPKDQENRQASLSVSSDSRFTWRDVLTILGILISLLTWLDTRSANSDQAKSNVKITIEQVIVFVLDNHHENVEGDCLIPEGDE